MAHAEDFEELSFFRISLSNDDVSNCRPKGAKAFGLYAKSANRLVTAFLAFCTLLFALSI
jgi:hypothetical protein